MSVVQINPCIVSERWAEVVEWAARVLDVPVSGDSEGWARLHAASDGIVVLDPKRAPLGSATPVVLELHVNKVDAMLERARGAGARVVAPAKKGEDGTVRAAIETPQGVVLWLRDEIGTARAKNDRRNKGSAKPSDAIHDGPLHFTVNRRLAVPPARVFEAITRKEDLEAFFVSKVEGDITKDLVVQWTFEGHGSFPIHRVDLRVNEFLSFHWASNQGYDTRVQLALRPTDGGTELAITESGWDSDPRGTRGAFDNCEGWTTFLANLSLYLEHGIAPRR